MYPVQIEVRTTSTNSEDEQSSRLSNKKTTDKGYKLQVICYTFLISTTTTNNNIAVHGS